MEKILTFEVDEIKLIQEISDSQLAVAEIKVCHTGMNKHKLPISFDTLKKATSTLINKFLVAGWSGIDFKGHEGKNQMIIGFFPKENNFRYVEENDKTYLVCNAIISKQYASWAYNVFKKDNYRECSMEITVLATEEKDDGNEWITAFIFNGVTVLGEFYHAACDGSDVEIIKFSTEDMISDCEKVYGDYLSFSTNQNTNFTQKEDKIVVFNKEEFVKTFSMTANEMYEMMGKSCEEIKYKEGDYEYSKYYMRDFDNKYIFAYNRQEGKLCAIPYEMKDSKVSCDFENVKNARLTYIVTDESENLIGFAEVIMEKKMSEFAKDKFDMEKNMKDMKEKMDADMDDMTKKMSTLETDNIKMSEKVSDCENEKTEFSTKLSSLEAENIELKTFKSNIEEQEKKTKIDFAINSVVEDLTQEQVDDWRDKVAEFESIELFSNAIKAFAYSVSKGKKVDDGIVTASIPFENKKNKNKKGLWD